MLTSLRENSTGNEKQNGSVLCRELIGLDLSDAKQLKKAHEEDVFEKKCAVFVKGAFETLAALSRNAKSF
jgi:hypothetical protein